ncbi:acVLRF1 family peptidyl-tRNA hydrolase [Nocardioides aurantiacus]|uniref:Actinobacteria/chloroflexi VLRF1 release factor domain-containing protein n=1 Tax=Nocardioides aurantiacus TaxID=86796 RepID=A0A3N2CSY6_9ACTN|nr:acVLRF1 family peptidyl-tRNA hydrolase [Nocardioides aurantiacus]ROR90651.1 hypothetical protein EDD33_1498 [Nocardioides aurantiacus]
MSAAGEVLVPAERVVRWTENFVARHGATSFVVADGVLHGTAADGSDFVARLPFDLAHAGPADPAALARACVTPPAWGLLLVRKGGFAVARLSGDRLVGSKTGQRHVQGRTKAGGQSQQRFARRRDNQARAAYDAAADHAARVLGETPLLLVTGGDREAVDAVVADRRLAAVSVVGPWLAVPDPRRAVLDQAVRDAQAVRVVVRNA